METEPTDLPYSYTTVVTTSSRIEKGLLAIPVSLLDLFPQRSGSIELLSENGKWESKSFTAYDSTSRECRIGGLSDFYRRYEVKSRDELVLQAFGNGRYRLVPERHFRRDISSLETELDSARSRPAR